MYNKLDFSTKTETIVKLDGKIVGKIKEVKTKTPTGMKLLYQYVPKGSKIGGDKFETLGECMFSIK